MSELGRFGHHPDPAIDFCVEVEEIEAIATDRELKFANPNDSELESRVLRALAFKVGGDLHAIKAKDRVRDIAKVLEDESFERADRKRAAAEDMYQALTRLLGYNEDIIAGRINYRPEDHAEVARAALSKAEGQQ